MSDQHNQPLRGSSMLQLPADLQRALEAALDAATPARWLREAQALSQRYRASRAGGEAALARGEDQALGYAALLLPATYAQLRGAMAATAARLPGWQPASMLDLGSGPGTALWAAAAQWPALRTAVAWEREPAFIALGRALARGSDAPAVRAARWERVDLGQPPGAGARYDLVVLGHVLNELDPAARRATVALAWQHTDGLLLVVEPGSASAFEVVRAARDQLLAAGAQTIAPCPHNRACPLQGDWCHFPQRLRRPPFQRRARGAPSEWEDSKFSYAGVARFAAERPIWGRAIREPTSNKGYAEVALCTVDAVVRQRGLKRHRDAFRAVKAIEWGDSFDAPPPGTPAEPAERHSEVRGEDEGAGRQRTDENPRRATALGNATDEETAMSNAPLSAEGTLEPQGITTYQYGSHVLRGARTYALRSEIDLDQYVGQRVQVTGTLLEGYPLSGGPPYLDVTDVRPGRP